ncbi:MAG TPA: ferritin [Ignavibacteriaceae bacterium]|nr:ferritin [Ignavibacteriaceae bacterium]
MLKEKVEAALNDQINEELYSSYLYLSMAAYFETQNFSGFSGWMRIQAQEEYAHAMKIYNYILDRDGNVNLRKIDAPKGKWKSHVEAFEDALKHEQKVSKSIYELVELSFAEKDHATNTFLQWFVNEQVEEESTALKIAERIKLTGDNKGALFMLDRELGMRSAGK